MFSADCLSTAPRYFYISEFIAVVKVIAWNSEGRLIETP
jgi:hypothetical protein